MIINLKGEFEDKPMENWVLNVFILLMGDDPIISFSLPVLLPTDLDSDE